MRSGLYQSRIGVFSNLSDLFSIGAFSNLSYLNSEPHITEYNYYELYFIRFCDPYNIFQRLINQICVKTFTKDLNNVT